jgi:anti-sigma B factor antagonist
MGRIDAESGTPMAFAIDEREFETVVTISGELDLSNVDDVDHALTPSLERGLGRLVVDGSGLTFADSSAIAMWVRWSTAVEDLKMRGMSPLLRKVIDSMGLGETLRIDE